MTTGMAAITNVTQGAQLARTNQNALLNLVVTGTMQGAKVDVTPIINAIENAQRSVTAVPVTLAFQRETGRMRDAIANVTIRTGTKQIATHDAISNVKDVLAILKNDCAILPN